MISQRLAKAFSGLGQHDYFERLLTRFSVPEELFGPLSIKALEEDRYYRQTEGYLPRARVAFLDEIFKANSAILNALLTLLNERAFDNGTSREAAPLISVVAASNEIPADGEEKEALSALYDRFLVRLWVHPVVRPESFFALVDSPAVTPEVDPPAQLRIAPDELRALRQQALATVGLTPAARALIGRLRQYLIDNSIPCSDRRWFNIGRLLKVATYLDRRTEVDIWDLLLLPTLIGSTREEHDKVLGFLKDQMNLSPAVANRYEEIIGVHLDPPAQESTATAADSEDLTVHYHRLQRNQQGVIIPLNAMFRSTFEIPGLDFVLRAWKVQPGSKVSKGDVLAVFEDGREFESPESGVVKELLAMPGTELRDKDPMLVLTTKPKLEKQKAAWSKPTTTASSARGNNPELQKIASELREVMTDLQMRLSEMQSIANTRLWLGGLLDFTAMEQDLRENERRMRRLLEKAGANDRQG
jgi:MoxR-like ATPase